MNASVKNIQADEILARAEARGRAAQLPYRGAVTPQEAWELVQGGTARVLDVRTGAEIELVGGIPGAEEIEWKTYPHWELNPDFLAQVRRRFSPADNILLVCRSAMRSHDAAALLAAEGFAACFNVLEGFEGEKNAEAQRAVNGWKVRGLPWHQ